jgi:hypothetical protein
MVASSPGAELVASFRVLRRSAWSWSALLSLVVSGFFVGFRVMPSPTSTVTVSPSSMPTLSLMDLGSMM